MSQYFGLCSLYYEIYFFMDDKKWYRDLLETGYSKTLVEWEDKFDTINKSNDIGSLLDCQKAFEENAHKDRIKKEKKLKLNYEWKINYIFLQLIFGEF